MSHRTPTIAELRLLLVKLGFQAVPTAGNHQVYRHDPTDTVIFLPSQEADLIPSATHTAAVRRALDEHGVSTTAHTDRILAQLVRSPGRNGARSSRPSVDAEAATR
jgi:predicted RNA binding protein YcfA (HicA-like mRNA interferase family)